MSSQATLARSIPLPSARGARSRPRLQDILSQGVAFFHVERHGKYSVERLVELHTFTTTQSTRLVHVRCFLTLLATPVPSLVLNGLIDVIPLSKPDNASNSHAVFWARLFLVGASVAYIIYNQYRLFIPELAVKMTNTRIVAMAVVVGGVWVQYLVAMSSAIGFPIPFSVIFAGPIFTILFWLGMFLLWWRELWESKPFRVEIRRAYNVVLVQWAVIFVYPAYAYFFGQTDGVAQTFFALLLPIMKMSARAAFSYALRFHNEDMRPEVVVFNAEIFHSLFVSCCMQSSNSLATTTVLTVMDAVEMLLSVGSVDPLVNELRNMEKQRSLARQSNAGAKKVPFVETALIFSLHREIQRASLTTGSRVRLMSRKGSIIPSRAQNAEVLPVSDLLMESKVFHPQPPHPLQGTRAAKYACEAVEDAFVTKLRALVALRGPASQPEDASTVSMPMLSSREQQKYVARTLQLFHVADVILLTAFAEVVVAVIYAGYLVAVYHLPNRPYYTQIATLTEIQLWMSVNRVLRYAIIDLLSFLFVCGSLKRKLGISPLHQLAFIVQKQWRLVQSKLVLWVLFVMTSTLVHCGYDYTFQFAWLTKPAP